MGFVYPIPNNMHTENFFNASFLRLDRKFWSPSIVAHEAEAYPRIKSGQRIVLYPLNLYDVAQSLWHSAQYMWKLTIVPSLSLGFSLP
jgi:hypothetical protein